MINTVKRIFNPARIAGVEFFAVLILALHSGSQTKTKPISSSMKGLFRGKGEITQKIAFLALFLFPPYLYGVIGVTKDGVGL
ncbi:MAG: hypothetical protein GY849_03255 [Deltaproteobacteria bacterium]|nr:hypothetical protein [Deltaproteobacteria bacterium]